MNTRKRQATEVLPLHRSPKYPRTTRHLSAIPRSEQEVGIGTRWQTIGLEFVSLFFETIAVITGGALPSDNLADVSHQSHKRTPRERTQSEPTQPSRSRKALTSMGPPPVPAQRPARVASLSTTSSEANISLSRGTTPPPTQSTSIHTSRPTTPSSQIPVADAAEPQRPSRAETRPPQPRQHIFHRQHKVRVRKMHEQDREAMTKELYDLKKAGGYGSDYSTFKEYLKYKQKIDYTKRDLLSPSPSLQDLRSAHQRTAHSRSASASQVPYLEDVHMDFLERAIQNARATMNEPKPPKTFVPSLDQLCTWAREKDAAIEERLRPKRPPLPSSLPPADEAKVDELMQKRGVISKFAREQVSDRDLCRLRPNEWLNDELINFYGAMILDRSEKAKKNGNNKALNVHYFSTFFYEKLVKDGYDGGRLAKWTKKIDIFAKDIILIPINHNNSHWTAAAINFRKKRIESYDSMDGRYPSLFMTLRSYLESEYRNKKKAPFDFTGWTNYTMDGTPQQENAFDCGVFTCQFMEALSRGEDTFNFQQSNMKYIRRRMIWEIGTAQLRED